MVRFSKYHALGNAYIVLETNRIPTPEQVKSLCHGGYGLGGDGILIGRIQGNGQFFLRIFNPDGSEAEKSGNGVRIFARYLHDMGQTGRRRFPIQTPGGEVLAEIDPDQEVIALDMGLVSFHSEDVPVAGPSREVLEERLHLGSNNLTYCAASLGNPHCVIHVDHLDEDFSRRVGPQIEINPLFPNRTNVQFMEVANRERIKIHIWERGAGFTLASGSSSCAAAAVAVRLGLCSPDITVEMPGGELQVTITEDFHALLRGPVSFIGRGVVALPG